MSQKKDKAPPVAELQSSLRASGLRSTGPRLAVLQELWSARSPLSHAEMAQRLQGQGFDRATVYRNLTDLVEAGLVSRSELGDHVWRFELRREDADHGNEHPHFVCVTCGQVSCLPEVDVRVPTAKAKRAPIAEIFEISIRGRCVNCA